MAIDTRERRQAVVGISMYFAGPNVTNDAAKGAPWRQEVGWGYPGIAASTPVTPTPGLLQFGQILHCGAKPNRRRGGMNMFEWIDLSDFMRIPMLGAT